MAILILTEHDNQSLKSATLNAVTAAEQIGGEIHLLVAGFNCGAVAEQAAQVNGVSRVILADNQAYQNGLAENVSALMVELAGDYSHLLAASTSHGKNCMPRVAAY